jgi:hypothetical protein
VDEETYSTKQRSIRDELDHLVVPEVQTAITAGQLLADLGRLWREATPEERHELLKPMISQVYVDLLQRRVVGIKPRLAFRELFVQAVTDSAEIFLVPPEEVEATSRR